MNITFIESSSYTSLKETIDELKEKAKVKELMSSANMALFEGTFGTGKTWAVEKIAMNQENSIVYWVASDTWTKSSVIKKLAEELGASGANTSELFEDVCAKQMVEQRVIIIDEVERILLGDKHKIAELFRELSDATSCAIVFIGMRGVGLKWKRWDHYHSRLQITKLSENTFEDIKAFCEMSEVEIEPAVVESIYKKYKNFRLVKRVIESLETFCEKERYESVDTGVYKLSKVDR